jgi:hypothetical protein
MVCENLCYLCFLLFKSCLCFLLCLFGQQQCSALIVDLDQSPITPSTRLMLAQGRPFTFHFSPITSHFSPPPTPLPPYVSFSNHIPRCSRRHLDRSLRNEPSEPSQPRVPRVWDPDDCGFNSALHNRSADSRILEDPVVTVYARLDLPIPRTCRRR